MKKQIDNKDDFLSVKDCTSTFDLALDYLKRNSALPYSFISQKQSKGRGRDGTQWQSSQGGLYITTALEASNSLQQSSLTPLYVALMLSNWINKTFAIKPNIKWPNDLLVAGKKLSGVLVENRAFNSKRVILIGVGVNIFNKSHVKDKNYSSTSIAEIKNINTASKEEAILKYAISLKNFIHSELNNFSSYTLLDYINNSYMLKNSFYTDNKQQLWLVTGLNKSGELELQKEQINKKVNSADNEFSWIYLSNRRKKQAFIVADIGNSLSKIAYYKSADDITPTAVLTLDLEQLSTDLDDNINNFIQKNNITPNNILHCISVANTNYSKLRKLFKKYVNHITPVKKRTIYSTIKTYPLQNIGIDRLANIEAYARQRSANPALIISCGSATTIDLLDIQNNHLGGTIGLGLKHYLSSLGSMGEQLPAISVDECSKINNGTDIAQNSKEAMIHAALHTQILPIYHYHNKLQELSNSKIVDIVLTGGLAHIIKPHLVSSCVIDKFLTLNGAKILSLGG